MPDKTPTGLLVVMTNSKDPARQADLNRWYDEVQLPNVLATGLYYDAARYACRNPPPGAGKYLALYLTDHPDPGAAFLELRSTRERRWELFRGLVTTCVATFEPTGRHKSEGLVRKGQRTTGLFFVTSNTTDPTREKAFNKWYDWMHVPNIVAGGLYYRAARYANRSPRPGEGKFLCVFETDRTDPVSAEAELGKYVFAGFEDENNPWFQFPLLEVPFKATFEPLTQ